MHISDRRKVRKTVGNGSLTGKTNVLRPWILRIARSAHSNRHFQKCIRISWLFGKDRTAYIMITASDSNNLATAHPMPT